MVKRILLVTFTLLLVVPAVAIFAQSQGTQGDSATGSGTQGSDSQKCVDVTRKVGLVTDRYDQQKLKYMTSFENVFKHMETIALKLKADGYDTATLEAHLAEYSTMMQNTNRYYNEFKVGLDNSKKGICGNSDADSGQEFNTARTQLMECKNEMLKLRTFAQETLKKDLEDLRAQITE